MLSSLSFGVTLVSCVLGESNPYSSDVGSNYFVDIAEEGSDYQAYYPYPLNLCTINGVLAPENVRYTCNSEGNRVTKSVYSDSDCTVLSSTHEYGPSDRTSLGAYEFNCDGVDSYATIWTCFDWETNEAPEGQTECDSCLYTSRGHWALGVCHYSGDGSSSQTTQSTCDSESMKVKNYKDEHVDDQCLIISAQIEARTNCSYFSRIKFGGTRVHIYAIMESCIIDGEEQVKSAEPVEVLTTEAESSSVEDSDENSEGDSGGDGATSNSNGDGGSSGSTDNALLAVVIVIACIAVIAGVFYYVRRKRKLAVADMGNVVVAEVSMDQADFGFGATPGGFGHTTTGADDDDEMARKERYESPDERDGGNEAVTGGDTYLDDADLSESDQNGRNDAGTEENFAAPERTNGAESAVSGET